MQHKSLIALYVAASLAVTATAFAQQPKLPPNAPALAPAQIKSSALAPAQIKSLDLVPGMIEDLNKLKKEIADLKKENNEQAKKLADIDNKATGAKEVAEQKKAINELTKRLEKVSGILNSHWHPKDTKGDISPCTLGGPLPTPPFPCALGLK